MSSNTIQKDTILIKKVWGYRMGVQAFRIIREKLGYTQYRMAKELGISQTQYSYLEKTAKDTQTKIWVKLKKISGITAEELFKLMEKGID